MKNIFRRPPFKIFQRGFSIVEILVALGLVAIIGAGLAAVISNAAKQQKGIQAKDQQREITAELRTLLADRTACLNTFGGVNPSGAGNSVSAVKDAVGAVRYNNSDNSTDKTGLLKFVDFQIANWTAATGNADFRVKLTKIGDTGTVQQILPDVITIKAKVVGGVISECFSIGTVSDSFWKVATNNVSNIFFAAGNVGFGTDKPTNLIEVYKKQNANTAVRIVNDDPGTGAFAQVEVTNLTAGGAFGIRGTGTTGAPYWNSNDTYAYGSQDMVLASIGPTNSIRFTTTSSPIERMRITSSGNVGIGTTTPQSLIDISKNSSADTFPNFPSLRISNANPVAGDGITTENYSSLMTQAGNGVVQGDIVSAFNSAGPYPSALYIRSITNHPITFVTNAGGGGPTVMTMTSSGNVGVGTLTPQEKIDVMKGNIKLTQEENFGHFTSYTFANAGGQHPVFGGLRGRGTAGAPSYPLLGDTLSAFIGRDAIDGYSVASYGGASIYIQATENFSAASKGSDLIIQTTPNGTGNPLERMRIDQNGNVGIGTITPAQKLDVNGNITATSFLYSSDARLKKEIRPLDHILQKLNSIRGVTYFWKNPKSQIESSRQLGVIAQEVNAVFPEAVQADPTGLLRVNYPVLVAPLIEAVHALHQENLDLEQRLLKLEKILQEKK